MPIGFARLEFVKRSLGKNACAKAAYNSRSRIVFEGNVLLDRETYDWSKYASPVYHEILLPEHVDEKFKNPEVLWNAVEQKDVRKNSQPAFEMVLALPDDKVISVEDKEYLAKSFVEKHFVKEDLAAQIDIHSPEQKVSKDDFSGEESKDHNWHAHVIVTTRRFKANGKELADHKARDLMPVLRGGRVISGPNWGKLWTQHQNTFFEQKGLSLRVDEVGVIPQKHLGPIRMRGRALSLLRENNLLISLNNLESEDPQNVLNKLTETQNIFSAEDVNRFLHKHVSPENVLSVKESFWKQSEIIQLLEPQSQKPLDKFTTQRILDEEKQILRLGDRLVSFSAFKINLKKADRFTQNLNQEQKEAFKGVITGKRLCCIEGYAGTGKSHLLKSLKEVYETNNCVVRGFGPDSASSAVLKKVGFSSAENVYRFLFALHKGKRSISKHREVWILDEAGKLGTRPLLELLKNANKYGAQVVLTGDSSQLPSVERGGMFRTFSEKYGSQRLIDIQRQKDESQREIAKKLAHGEMGQALDKIVGQGSIKWTSSKEEAVESLVKAWAYSSKEKPNDSSLIIAHSNREVRALNELGHLFRREAGELTGKEYCCETAFGKIHVCCGDRIEFRKNDNKLGVTNGMEGVLIKAAPDSFTIQLTEGDHVKKVTFDPKRYRSFQLGYATTYYRSQGRTVDRAYVLHSPMMNKEMFYVGLTRHVKRAEFFVTKEQATCLSDLKRQAFSHLTRTSTLEYLTHSGLQKQKMEKERDQKLQEMKSSDSIFSKMKGMGFSAWVDVCSKASKVVEKYKDQSPDKEFFNPKLANEKTDLGTVKETKDVQIEEDRVGEEKGIHSELHRIAKIENAQSVKKRSGKMASKEKRAKLSEHKPLYNLHLLKKYPNAKVLIVEGEKTADAASKLFPSEKIVCLTWLGGAVSKADWNPLKGRGVIIWPDNDKAGFGASDLICEQLKAVGVKSLQEIDRKILAQELPPKWDLADSLPEGKNSRFVRDLMLRSKVIQIESSNQSKTDHLENSQSHELSTTVKRNMDRELEI